MGVVIFLVKSAAASVAATTKAITDIPLAPPREIYPCGCSEWATGSRTFQTLVQPMSDFGSHLTADGNNTGSDYISGVWDIPLNISTRTYSPGHFPDLDIFRPHLGHSPSCQNENLKRRILVTVNDLPLCQFCTR